MTLSSNSPELQALIFQVFRLDDRLKEIANQLTAPAGQTGARWQIMNAVADGPRTVSEIARMKNITRQSAQRLADVMADEGVARFVKNPRHQRVALLELTSGGRRALKDIQGRRNSWLEKIAGKLAGRDLRRAGIFLTQLERLLAMEGEPS